MTVARKIFKKVWPRILNYKWFKYSPNETFRIGLESNFSKEVYVTLMIGKRKVLQNNHGYVK